jgi:endonuclease/exonuclease/phosphatase family metal-dependent hydrolase
MHLALATYNIHACVGIDDRFDPARIVAVLRELDADIVALQEVENRMVGDLALLQYLGSETGLLAVAGPTLQRETGHYGNALLTRLPVLSVDRIDLSLPQREPRGAVNALLDCQGRQLRVVATHLGLRPGERRQQVRQLLRVFETNNADVNILLGDLNEWLLWGRPLRWLRRYFGHSAQPRTFPARYPLFALDRIWAQPRGALIATRRHASPAARVASDHLPVTARLLVDA